jgi:tRNA1(Val) A37 N6-methylase TrmN6
VDLIYPAPRLVDLLFQLRLKRLEPKAIQIVHPDVTTKGNLVMVEAIKGGKEEVRIMEPLFVYDLNGNYSKEMKRILAVS